MAGGQQNAMANRPQGGPPQAKQQQTRLTLAESEEKLESAIKEFGSATGRLGRVVAIANATRVARDMVRAHWRDFADLRNSKLGWFSDKDYNEEVLQTAITQALLKGALPVNNEIGVIGGGMYLQKTYFERQFRERPEISDVRIVLDVPELQSGRALVGGEISWRIDGKEDRIVCRKSATGDQRIPVRVNAGQSDDQVLGKATRKILARALARIDGSQAWEELAADDSSTVAGTAETVASSSAEGTPTPKPEPVAPAKPTREQLNAAWEQIGGQLKAASSNSDVDAIVSYWFGERAPIVWPEKWEKELANRILERRKAFTATTSDPAPPQADEPTPHAADASQLPAGNWDEFRKGMYASDDPKVFGAFYDRHFGPEAAFRWTPEQEAEAGKVYQDRVAECRPK